MSAKASVASREIGFIETMDCLPVSKLPQGPQWTYEIFAANHIRFLMWRRKLWCVTVASQDIWSLEQISHQHRARIRHRRIYFQPSGVDSIVVGFIAVRVLFTPLGVRASFVPRTRREVFEMINHLRIAACPFVNLPELMRRLSPSPLVLPTVCCSCL